MDLINNNLLCFRRHSNDQSLINYSENPSLIKHGTLDHRDFCCSLGNRNWLLQKVNLFLYPLSTVKLLGCVWQNIRFSYLVYSGGFFPPGNRPPRLRNPLVLHTVVHVHDTTGWLVTVIDSLIVSIFVGGHLLFWLESPCSQQLQGLWCIQSGLGNGRDGITNYADFIGTRNVILMPIDKFLRGKHWKHVTWWMIG